MTDADKTTPRAVEVEAAAATEAAPPIVAPAAVSALKAEADGDLAMASSASTPIPTMEEQAISLKVSLADICAKGAAAYSHKEYEKAADLYAQAADMQAEMNGEMSPDNAEILFLYGRSLFKVGQSKSDVLGGKAPATTGEEKPKGEKKEKEENKAAKITAAEAENKEVEKRDGKVEAKKPLFQFTGDENFEDDSDEEDGEGEEGEEGEVDEEEDDMGVAFQILDLARVLFGKRLEAATEVPDAAGGKGKEAAVSNGEMSPELKHVKERLADTHDLLTEISWENERYAQSITDARKSLDYKKELYGDDNEIVAEAHYKVSLALEFASVTQTEEDAEEAGGASVMDEGLREEAAKELENAIRCTKLNLENKEVELATSHAPDENEVTRSRIAEVKELIAEMEQRLEDLRKPPIDINAAIASGTGAAGGLLGALASGAADSAQQIEDAKKNATDLTGLVRKKKKMDEASPAPRASTEPEAANSTSTSNGTKRKAEEPAAEEEESKKAKVEGAAVAGS